jgi:hypothetical protein
MDWFNVAKDRFQLRDPVNIKLNFCFRKMSEIDQLNDYQLLKVDSTSQSCVQIHRVTADT